MNKMMFIISVWSREGLVFPQPIHVHTIIMINKAKDPFAGTLISRYLAH